MEEAERNGILDVFGPIEDQMQNIIKVIGVGGGGCNAVSNMYSEGIKGVTFAACNTDSASLKSSSVPVKIMLGEGLGAGGKPEVGKSEAESSLDSIEKLLDDQTKMVFVTATMGGGTGTGAAPVVARVAREKGLLTIGVVTIPFYFEHRRKIIKALKGVDELRKNVDAILIVNNERLCDIYSNTNVSLPNALADADNVLKNAVKGISELITISSKGNINLDFRDVETTMRNGGGAIMAIGRAKGDHRVEKAIIDALNSPLLHGNDISKAKRILFNIYASDDYPVLIPEMQEVDEFFDQLDPDIDVIWGTSTDESLGEDAKVIILATDMDDDLVRKEAESRQETKDDYYEDLIKKLYKPLGTKKATSTATSKEEEPQKEEEPKTEEPTLVVNPITIEPKPEPAPNPITPNPIENPTGEPPSAVNKLMNWLDRKIKYLTQDEDID